MHWIRKNSRFGSWAAVFALALQLVLSFGHIHAEDFQDSIGSNGVRRHSQIPTLPMMTTAARGTISAPSARRSISHHRLCCLRLRCSQPRSINPTAGPLFYVPRTFPTAFILFSRRGRLPTPSESMTKDLGS